MASGLNGADGVRRNGFVGLARWKDKTLFTPGPLTTSRSVKQAMLRDVGSRDFEFIEMVADIRRRLVALAEANTTSYTAVPMQGSGTFGLESVVGSVVPQDGKLLVGVNGAYGRRMMKMAGVLGVAVTGLEFPESEPVEPAAIQRAVQADNAITHVAVCHCETTSGILNPVADIGSAVRAEGRSYIVDGMSSFGAVPASLEGAGIDFLVSSSNKCIESVPGFSFVLARKEALLAAEGRARSLALDLVDQYRVLEETGQFRFTPPTHALLAFHQALLELEAEGGVRGRAERYKRNHETLTDGMRSMGFSEYLPADLQSHIITSFRYPRDERFHFDTFYRLLNESDEVIYPGKVGDAPCFRIGTIGRIFPSDVRSLLSSIGRAVREMKFVP